MKGFKQFKEDNLKQMQMDGRGKQVPYMVYNNEVIDADTLAKRDPNYRRIFAKIANHEGFKGYAKDKYNATAHGIIDNTLNTISVEDYEKDLEIVIQLLATAYPFHAVKTTELDV